MNSNNNQKGGFSNIILWMLIFLSLIIIYAFRFELHSVKDRILAVIIPSYSWSDDQGRLVIARSTDGHFYIQAKDINDNEIKFLIDTGASDIALSKKDAIKLGFNPENLRYTKQYRTANGIGAGAPVIIKQLKLGDKIFYNVSASVNQNLSGTSLLGMSLIDDFENFQITKDLLILKY